MPRSKELFILLALFVVMVAGTLWYVVDRRAKNHARRPAASQAMSPAPSAPGPLIEKTPPAPVALGTRETERKTIDFSSGQAVIKDTPEDQAALEAGLRDIAAATKDVKFEAGKTETKPDESKK